MKFFYTLLLIISLFVNSYGQQILPKFNLDIKIGSEFTGTGDLWMYSNSLKINYLIKNKLGVFIEPAFSFGKNNSPLIFLVGPGLNRNYYRNSVKLNTGFNLNLLQKHKFSILLTPHLSLAKMLSVNQSTAFRLPPNFNIQPEFSVVYLPPMIKNDYTFGGGIGINPTFQISEKKALGICITTQYFVGGYIDHNFNICLKLGL